MGRFMLYLAVATIAGTGIATAFGLFTASLVAAVAKSKAGIDTPVAAEVQTLVAPLFSLDLGLFEISVTWIMLAALFGFVAGFGVITRMYYGGRQSQGGSEDAGAGDRSEV